MKRYFIHLAIIFTVALFCAPIASAQQSQPAQPTKSAHTDDLSRQITLSIPSITCPICAGKIKKALTGQPGVGKIDVDPKKKTCTVELTSNDISVDSWIFIINEAGYRSQVVTKALIYKTTKTSRANDWRDYVTAFKGLPGMAGVALTEERPTSKERYLYFVITVEEGRVLPQDFARVIKDFEKDFEKIYPN